MLLSCAQRYIDYSPYHVCVLCKHCRQAVAFGQDTHQGIWATRPGNLKYVSEAWQTETMCKKCWSYANLHTSQNELHQGPVNQFELDSAE